MLTDRITELKRLLLSEVSLVGKMVTMSIDGLYKHGHAFLEEVLQFEQRVNKIELELDSMCVSTIALFQPEARDLRYILMMYKINNDLERLGDQAVNIAESAAHLAGNPIVKSLPELMDMKEATLSMLRNSFSAFTSGDVAQAKQVCEDDNIVDDLNRTIYLHLVEMMKSDPSRINDYQHLLRIARNLERVADLSTNIAENTVYMVEGKNIRHHIEEQEQD